MVIGDVLMDYHLQIPSAAGATRREQDEILELPFPTKIPLAEPIEAMPGGNAFNVAMVLAKLGLHTQIYTEVGEDSAGNQIIQDLDRLGVDTSFIKQHSGKAATNTAVILSTGGDRVIFTYHYPRDYQLPNLAETKYVYLTSVGEDDHKLFQEVLKSKMSNNFKLMFSPGSTQLREEFAEIAPAMAASDLLLLNKDEAQSLTRSNSEDDEQLVWMLADFGPKAIVMTKSAQGSIALWEGEVIRVGAKKVDVVDTTGAGDTFSATVCAALSIGKDIRTAMEWGALHSANVVQGVGCEDFLLNKEELEQSHQMANNSL